MSNSHGIRNGNVPASGSKPANGIRPPNGISPVLGGPIPPLETILRKRRIFITGGTGFLGKVLLAILLRHHPEIERIFLLIRSGPSAGDSRISRWKRSRLDLRIARARAAARKSRGAV